MWIKDIRDYILYEDKDILVCHKPAGLAVQNARVGNMDMEPGSAGGGGSCICPESEGSSRSQQTDDSGKNKEDLSCSYRRNSESEECKTGGLAEEGWQDQQLCSG